MSLSGLRIAWKVSVVIFLLSARWRSKALHSPHPCYTFVSIQADEFIATTFFDHVLDVDYSGFGKPVENGFAGIGLPTRHRANPD